MRRFCRPPPITDYVRNSLFAVATLASVERWDPRRATGFGCVVAGGILLALSDHPVAAAALVAAGLVAGRDRRLAAPAAAAALAAGAVVGVTSLSGLGLTS